MRSGVLGPNILRVASRSERSSEQSTERSSRSQETTRKTSHQERANTSTEAPTERTPQATSAVRPAAQLSSGELPQRQYTAEEADALFADGYFVVHPGFWDYIPEGALVRYVLKASAAKADAKHMRVRPGGTVKGHIFADGKKMLQISPVEPKKKTNGRAFTFPLAYDDVEEIWKRYDRGPYIEMHLIANSLGQKDARISELEKKCELLISKIEKLDRRLRAKGM